MCAAEVNREFGLDDAIADTIVKAAKEVSDGPGIVFTSCLFKLCVD